MRRSGVLAALVAAAFTIHASPADAGPARTTATPVRMESPTGALQGGRVTGDPRVVVLGPGALRTPVASAAAGHAGDPPGLAHLRASLLRIPGSVEISPPQAASGSSTQRVTSARTLATADIDGDGFRDLVTTEVSADYEPDGSGDPSLAGWHVRYAARRGSDGALFWITDPKTPRSFYWAFPWDLDGDGVPEIVTIDFHYLQADEDTCNTSDDFDQIVTVRSGTTGGVEWEWHHPSSWTFVCVGRTVFVRAFGAVGWMEPIPAEDGHADLLVTTEDFLYADEGIGFSTCAVEAASVVSPRVARVDPTVHLLGGTDGSPVATFSTETLDDFPAFGALDDPGSASPAIMLQTETEVSARALDGTVRWRTTIDARGWWSLSFVDPIVAADTTDVWVIVFSWSESCEPEGGLVITIKPDHLITLNGWTGALLVDKQTEGSFDIAGSADGDGGLDFYDLTPAFAPTLTASMFSGRTGGRLADIGSFSAPGTEASEHWVSAWAVNFDGDAVNDLLVRGEALTSSWDLVAVRNTGVSGGHGAILWETEGTSDEETIYVMDGDGPQDHADLDLDGGADVVTLDESWTWHFYNGSSLQPLFDLSDDDVPGAGFFVRWASDFTPHPGRELIVSTKDGPVEDQGTRLHIMSRTSVLWSFDARDDFRF